MSGYENVPLFDLAPERVYHAPGLWPAPFCSDCRKPKPFMPYEGGTGPRDAEGRASWYELCESCANDSLARAARKRARQDAL